MSAELQIAVIDDDEPFRTALLESLRSLGYGARGFASAEEFVAAEGDGDCDCVITDIHMPGTNGATVISELKQRHPQIAVIAISGLFDSGHGLGADDALALGAARALAKPFKRAELLRATTELLGPPDP